MNYAVEQSYSFFCVVATLFGTEEARCENKKKTEHLLLSLRLSGGRRTRTTDLWVMSPTSYHCSIPRFALQRYCLFPHSPNISPKKYVLKQ